MIVAPVDTWIKRVLINLADDAAQIVLNIPPFQSGMNSSSHTPEVFVLFHQVDLESLVRHSSARWSSRPVPHRPPIPFC